VLAIQLDNQTSDYYYYYYYYYYYSLVLMVSSLVAGTTAMMGRNLERNIIPHCIDVYDQTLNSQTLPSIAKAGNQKRPLVSATA
jgi:hypothetical protein